MENQVEIMVEASKKWADHIRAGYLNKMDAFGLYNSINESVSIYLRLVKSSEIRNTVEGRTEQ